MKTVTIIIAPDRAAALRHAKAVFGTAPTDAREVGPATQEALRAWWKSIPHAPQAGWVARSRSGGGFLRAPARLI